MRPEASAGPDPAGPNAPEHPPVPAFDAVILAGGRSSRLGGVPKAGLRVDGKTLLELALGAVTGARRAVVVGPPELAGITGGVPVVREEPPFAGPAAAVAAGLAALGASDAAQVLVLACDMPRIGAAVPVLLGAAADRPEAEAILAADAGGRAQPLAAVFRSEALRRAVARSAGTNGLVNASMFALLASLQWEQVPVDAGATADIDTWDDAHGFGILPVPDAGN